MKHGHGEFELKDGSSYKGMWKCDIREGSGVEKDINGRTYQGEWRNGVKHGFGMYAFPDGKV
jgi:hypothetical protein